MTGFSKVAFAGVASLALAACQQAETDAEQKNEEAAAPAVDESQITLGNGEKNSITTEGITRSGATFTIPELTIERAGFLVMHPFRDGEPVRNEYVGAQAVAAGTSENVTIDVSDDPAEGDMYIVMLHFDMNEDGMFDFGDGETVPDAPALEGTTLIAHPIAAPAG